MNILNTFLKMQNVMNQKKQLFFQTLHPVNKRKNQPQTSWILTYLALILTASGINLQLSYKTTTSSRSKTTPPSQMWRQMEATMMEKNLWVKRRQYKLTQKLRIQLLSRLMPYRKLVIMLLRLLKTILRKRKNLSHHRN